MSISRRKVLGIFGGGAVLAATANSTTNTPPDSTKSVAIIGGGVSGLSVAYFLVRRGYKGKITIVEKSPTLGGNAATAEVLLGTDYRGAGIIRDFVRYADLGVNDVNLASYKRLKQAMKYIGYLSDENLKPGDENLKPLEDTVAHFTPDFSEIWTKDGYLTGQAEPAAKEPIDTRRGIIDRRYSLQEKDSQLAADEQEFMQIAAADFKKQDEPPKWWYYSVAEYIKFFEQERRADTEISLDNLRRLVRLFLYPRISAMYFADKAGPGGMPMAGVMSYYRLQEGIASDDKEAEGVDRRYFTKGSQHWINELAKWLQKNNVEIFRGFDAVVVGSDGRVKVTDVSEPNSSTTNPKSFVVDQVVMAGHADQQLRSLTTQLSSESLLSEEMKKKLESVQHSISCAYAHTWNRLLPPDRRTWRTYNVMIRYQYPDPTRIEPPTETPYQMTYVQNRHRNDRLNDDFNRYGMPIYFVSLNPEQEIPKEYILRRTEDDRKKVSREQPGYWDEHCANDSKEGLATARFRHIVMTTDLLKIQAELPQHQGMSNGRVFFAGCWTNGASLHEECFEQAERVVAAMWKDE